jgi:GDP-4-dehydro-6-deoxy-D-mannose reductase
MRILVLGASGFVGRHFLALARGRGDRVAGTHHPGEPRPADPADAWHPVDLLDSDSIDAALRAAEPEGVLHLAGQADVARANRDPVGTFRINAEGTLRVLESVRRVAPGARTVVVGSAEAYGMVPASELPVSEARPLAPRTAYGTSKAAVDVVAAQAATGWGLAVVRMRPFNHIGPGQRLGFVAPDFAAQVAAAERGILPPVLKVGNLSGLRDFTDVRDIVRGYRTALDRGRAGEAYNLCSGRSVAIEDIVRFFVERARVDVEIRPDETRLRPVEVPEFRGDPSRARRELGWSPEIPLEASLNDVLDEWRAAADADLAPVI